MRGPGLARLVTVPDSNRERDFFAAHADAFGIEYGPGATTAELKRQVEFVHRHSGLFLIYDEAHYLVPVSYHKATPPRRLNWVRCQVIDRGLGCAFFATPQSYRETLDAYVKKTGYCMEQWLGRMAPPVVLPESLDSADVLAVARNHFPDVPEPYLKLISARAMQSEGYLKNVEICVKRARFLAGEHGRRAPALADVQDAIGYTMPQAVPPVSTAASASRRGSARAMQPARSVSAKSPQTVPEAEFPRRGTLPKVGSLEPVLAG
ncbi:MAG: ATP-binding protein [Verrucomicrobia bacterium]|nr:ATP-binding protein [Verrucomicrobiota bacterium]